MEPVETARADVPGSSTPGKYIRIGWSDRGDHPVEFVGISKVSEVRKLCMHALRTALRRVHAGKALAERSS